MKLASTLLLFLSARALPTAQSSPALMSESLKVELGPSGQITDPIHNPTEKIPVDYKAPLLIRLQQQFEQGDYKAGKQILDEGIKHMQGVYVSPNNEYAFQCFRLIAHKSRLADYHLSTLLLEGLRGTEGEKEAFEHVKQLANKGDAFFKFLCAEHIPKLAKGKLIAMYRSVLQIGIHTEDSSFNVYYESIARYKLATLIRTNKILEAKQLLYEAMEPMRDFRQIESSYYRNKLAFYFDDMQDTLLDICHFHPGNNTELETTLSSALRYKGQDDFSNYERTIKEAVQQGNLIAIVDLSEYIRLKLSEGSEKQKELESFLMQYDPISEFAYLDKQEQMAETDADLDQLFQDLQPSFKRGSTYAQFLMGSFGPKRMAYQELKNLYDRGVQHPNAIKRYAITILISHALAHKSRGLDRIRYHQEVLNVNSDILSTIKFELPGYYQNIKKAQRYSKNYISKVKHQQTFFKLKLKSFYNASNYPQLYEDRQEFLKTLNDAHLKGLDVNKDLYDFAKWIRFSYPKGFNEDRSIQILKDIMQDYKVAEYRFVQDVHAVGAAHYLYEEIAPLIQKGCQWSDPFYLYLNGDLEAAKVHAPILTGDHEMDVYWNARLMVDLAETVKDSDPKQHLEYLLELATPTAQDYDALKLPMQRKHFDTLVANATNAVHDFFNTTDTFYNDEQKLYNVTLSRREENPLECMDQLLGLYQKGFTFAGHKLLDFYKQVWANFQSTPKEESKAYDIILELSKSFYSSFSSYYNFLGSRIHQDGYVRVDAFIEQKAEEGLSVYQYEYANRLAEKGAKGTIECIEALIMKGVSSRTVGKQVNGMVILKNLLAKRSRDKAKKIALYEDVAATNLSEYPFNEQLRSKVNLAKNRLIRLEESDHFGREKATKGIDPVFRNCLYIALAVCIAVVITPIVYYSCLLINRDKQQARESSQSGKSQKPKPASAAKTGLKAMGQGSKQANEAKLADHKSEDNPGMKAIRSGSIRPDSSKPADQKSDATTTVADKRFEVNREHANAYSKQLLEKLNQLLKDSFRATYHNYGGTGYKRYFHDCSQLILNHFCSLKEVPVLYFTKDQNNFFKKIGVERVTLDREQNSIQFDLMMNKKLKLLIHFFNIEGSKELRPAIFKMEDSTFESQLPSVNSSSRKRDLRPIEVRVQDTALVVPEKELETQHEINDFNTIMSNVLYKEVLEGIADAERPLLNLDYFFNMSLVYMEDLTDENMQVLDDLKENGFPDDLVENPSELPFTLDEFIEAWSFNIMSSVIQTSADRDPKDMSFWEERHFHNIAMNCCSQRAFDAIKQQQKAKVMLKSRPERKSSPVAAKGGGGSKEADSTSKDLSVYEAKSVEDFEIAIRPLLIKHSNEVKADNVLLELYRDKKPFNSTNIAAKDSATSKRLLVNKKHINRGYEHGDSVGILFDHIEGRFQLIAIISHDSLVKDKKTSTYEILECNDHASDHDYRNGNKIRLV